MRVRLFLEVEISDEALLKQFGAALPNVTAEIPSGLAKATEQLVKHMVPHVSNVGVCIVPELM